MQEDSYERTEPLMAKSGPDADESKYKTTPYRWCILAVVSMHLSLQTLLLSTMTPAAVELTQSFGLSSTVWVNLCAMSFGICSVPFTFISIWAFKRYPTSTVLRLASAWMFTGA